MRGLIIFTIAFIALAVVLTRPRQFEVMPTKSLPPVSMLDR
jgi:hypothetical protein